MVPGDYGVFDGPSLADLARAFFDFEPRPVLFALKGGTDIYADVDAVVRMQGDDDWLIVGWLNTEPMRVRFQVQFCTSSRRGVMRVSASS